MNSKFWFLVKTSLNKKIKTKTFIIVNILLLVGVISLTNIDRIVKYFGGDFDKTNNIMIVDNTKNSYDIFKDDIKSHGVLLDTGLKYKITKEKDEKKAKEKIKKEEDILIVFNNSTENILDVNLVTYGYIDVNLYNLIQTSIDSTKQYIGLKKLNVSEEEYKLISKSVDINREYINKDKNKDEEQMNMIMSIVTPIMILPFYFLIVFVIQMIGAEINEEKSTRSMEIIISNVSAKTHFFSKVLASNLFTLIQVILVSIYGFIGIKIRGGMTFSTANLGEVGEVADVVTKTDFLSTLYGYIPLILVLMILTILAYSMLAGILASMTTNMEDFQQLQTPIVAVSLVGFYLALMSSMFKGALFIRIVSYIPLVSAILSPSLLLTGVIGMKDLILSILLMILLVYLLVKYGFNIYKEGILNYSGSNLWKKMLKALKEDN